MSKRLQEYGGCSDLSEKRPCDDHGEERTAAEAAPLQHTEPVEVKTTPEGEAPAPASLHSMEFHRTLKMDLSGDPETRHKQLVGINDGNYPNHPVFLQVAQHLWSTAGLGALHKENPKPDATEAAGKSDGKVLSKRKNWYITTLHGTL